MKSEELMAGEDSEPEELCSELTVTHFTIGKIKSNENSGVQRSGIGLIAEFRGIPNGFPNQVSQGKGQGSLSCFRCCQRKFPEAFSLGKFQ
jgi:hypothetical protein